MKKLNFKSLLIQIFLSFLVLTSVILSLVSIVIYSQYTTQVINETNKTSEKMLSQNAHSVDFIWDWISSYAFELYNDGYIFNLIYGGNASPDEEMYADKKMSQAVVNNPLVYSIYLYNGNMRKIYSSLSRPYSMDDFFDQDILSLLKDKTLYRELEFIPRRIKYNIYGKEYVENILTLIIVDSPLTNEPAKGALIVNIKESQIQNMIQSLNPDEDDEFIIVDKNGKVISHSDSNMFLNDMSAEEHIKKIVTSSSVSGYFTELVNGKKSMVIYKSSDRLKWKFVRISSYEKIIGKTYRMRNLILVLCLILFIVVFIASLWISKKVYSPVNKLVEKISNQGDKKVHKKNISGKSEIEYISESFLKVIENVNYLQYKLKDNMNLIRQELLRNFLKEATSYSGNIEDKFEELGIKIKSKGIMLFLLRIDDYWHVFCSQNNEEDQSLLRFAVANIASEITSMYYVNEAIDMGGEFIAVVFNTDDKDINSSENSISLLEARIIQLIKQIQIYSKKYFNITISGSVGKFAINLLELPQVYEFAKDLSNYRLIYGKESVITTKMISSNIKEEYCYSDEIEKSILDSLRLRKYIQVEEKMTKLFEDLHYMQYSDIIMSISRLSYASLKVVHIFNQTGSIDARLDFGILYKQIVRFDILGEIKEWLLDIYRQAIEKEEDGSQNVKMNYVDKIKEIINSEYGNPNMTVDELAIRVNLSVNYMRAIFKELSGISLSNYINNYRYKRAEELLMKTELTVTEICLRVGILNENYFFTSFKKHNGLTPDQFRKNSRERRNSGDK